MKQTIYRHASSGLPFTQICNDLPRSKLSIEAKGLMLSVLSLPLDWKFNRKWAMNELGLGEDKLRRVMDELIEAGYCRARQERSTSGAFSQVSYSFSDIPHMFGDEEGVTPYRVSTATGFPRTRKNRVHTKKDTNKKEKETKTPLPPIQASATQAAALQTSSVATAKLGCSVPETEEEKTITTPYPPKGEAISSVDSGIFLDIEGKAPQEPTAKIIAFARAKEQQTIRAEAEQPRDTLKGNPSPEICKEEEPRFGGWSLEQIENAIERQSQMALKTPIETPCTGETVYPVKVPPEPKKTSRSRKQGGLKPGALEAFTKVLEHYPNFPESRFNGRLTPSKKDQLKEFVETNGAKPQSLNKALKIFSKYNEGTWPTILKEVQALEASLYRENYRKLGNDYAKFVIRPLRFITDLQKDLMERHAEALTAEQRMANYLLEQQEAKRLAAEKKAAEIEKQRISRENSQNKKKGMISAIKAYAGDRIDEIVEKVEICKKSREAFSVNPERWLKYVSTLNVELQSILSDWFYVRMFVSREALA
jgi:hypothetical protein